MTRLAITADIHADDFGSAIDPATGLARRWTDCIDMVRWIAADAKARGADALLIAGDFTETRNPAPPRVAQIGEAIATFGGRTILLRGNHDAIRADRSIVDALAQGRPGWDGFTRPGIAVVGDTAIVAMPYLDRHHLRATPGFAHVSDADVFRVLSETYVTIAAGLYVQARQLVPGPVVLAFHQSLAGGQMSDSQAAFLGDLSLVVDPRSLSAIGFEAIVGGHFHKHQILATDPLVAYAGAPLRTDFGEEHQEKAYLILDVARGSAAVEVVPTPARRYVTFDDATIGDARALAPEAIVRARFADPDVDVADVRRFLEEVGAFEVTTVEAGRRETPAIAGGLAEGLTAESALESYFADDADREALVARGRELLQAAA